jgi:hypothetical protein
MNFFNEKSGQVVTVKQLVAQGYLLNTQEIDLPRLRKLGLYPITYNYPLVPDTYQMEPDTLTKYGDHYERAFKIVDAPLEAARAQLLDRVAEKRWKVETGGIEINDIKVSTDRQSQAMITQTVAGLNLVNATDAPIEKVKFKADSGFVELTPEQIAYIGMCVTRHVEKCYALEAELCEEILTAPDLEALRAVDLTFEV